MPCNWLIGSAHNLDFLRELGASAVIDYTATRFEEVVHGVDLVFDTVGGDTLQRSWQVVKPGGVLASVVSPCPSFAEAQGYGVRQVWFVVQPNREQLVRIGALIDEGERCGPSSTRCCLFPRRARPTSRGRKGIHEGRLSCVWWNNVGRRTIDGYFRESTL